MTGKASNTKTTVDIIKKQRRDVKKAAGLARQTLTGFSSGQASSTVRSPVNSSSSAGSNTGNFIRSSGDTMIGPLAFYFQSKYIASGILDISQSTGAYSSRVIVIGQGAAADDLEVILGASHAGQILFFQPIQAVTLQSYLKTATAWATSTSYSVGDVVLDSSQRYTCHVAHTSSSATDPGSGADWETKWYRNNIRITGATERVVAIDEIILLQYDSTDGVWTVVSGGGSSGSNLLTSNNNFTGINSFTNASGAFTVSNPTVSLGTNAGNINILGTLQMSANYATFSAMTAPSASLSTTRKLFVDTADNKLKIRTNTGSIDLEAGGAGLGTANVWTDVNTFQSTVSMTGPTVNLGDSTNDRVNFISQVGTDINMGTYDVINLDRLKFATAAGAGSALGTSDTGIEAQFSGGSSAGVKLQVPANNIYQFFIGSTEKFNIGTSISALNMDLALSGYLAIGDNYMEFGDMTSANVGTTPANKRRVFSDSANNDELSVKKSDGSVVSLEGSGGGGVSLGGTNTWTGQQTFSNQNTIIQNDLTVYDNVTIQDDLQVYDDVTLGSSISDDIDINGRVEWGNSYTAYTSSYPSIALGYITIKVGGVTRNIWVS
tara:strand:- start:226 stop:2043 length:1818 start_codon:yes stop_codon:yes gene_type:complete